MLDTQKRGRIAAATAVAGGALAAVTIGAFASSGASNAAFTGCGYGDNGYGNTTAAGYGSCSTVTGTVTPSTGLTNGQSVTVTAAGFAASSSVFLVECANTSGTAGCAVSTTLLPATADGSGHVNTPFTVRTGTIGNGTCDATSTTCFIAVSDGTSVNYVALPISFAAATTSPSPSPTTTSPTTSPSPSKAASPSPSTSPSPTTAPAATCNPFGSSHIPSVKLDGGKITKGQRKGLTARCLRPKRIVQVYAITANGKTVKFATITVNKFGTTRIFYKATIKGKLTISFVGAAFDGKILRKKFQTTVS